MHGLCHTKTFAFHARYHDHCPQEHLSWAARLPKLLKEIKLYAPDILCLQEVEQPVFKSQLSLTDFQVLMRLMTPDHPCSAYAVTGMLLRSGRDGVTSAAQLMSLDRMKGPASLCGRLHLMSSHPEAAGRYQCSCMRLVVPTRDSQLTVIPLQFPGQHASRPQWGVLGPSP